MKALRLGPIVALLTIATVAFAGPLFKNTLVSAYKIPAGSQLDKALKSMSTSCAVCHSSLPNLNKYGADIKAQLRACNNGKDVPYDKVTGAMFKEALQKIEAKDSDGDGVNNVDEVKAGTLPGDPKSKPADTPKPADQPAKPADAPNK